MRRVCELGYQREADTSCLIGDSTPGAVTLRLSVVAGNTRGGRVWARLEVRVTRLRRSREWTAWWRNRHRVALYGERGIPRQSRSVGDPVPGAFFSA